ncbi:MAG: tetratricopeptide repeat protein [Crocosphaera sp.]
MKAILSSLITLGICLTPINPILTLQTATAQTENLRQQIQQLIEQAQQQSIQGKPFESIETLKQLLTIAQQLQSRDLEAFSLLGLGFNYNTIGQLQQAVKEYEQALVILREIKNSVLEATTLNNIGLVYDKIGQPKQALDYYQQALPIMREVGDRSGEARTLSNIGAVYLSIGQPKVALDYFNQALPIIKKVGDRSGEAGTLNNIGEVYRSIGKPKVALDYLNQALPIRREVGDRSGEAATLNNIGAVYLSIGQPNQALDYFNQALPIMKEVGDRSGEAVTLTNIGAVYSSIGKPNQALDYLNQALPIRREVGDRSGEAVTLTNIGAVYRSIGKPNQALDYFQQALPIMKEVGDRSGEAGTLSNIGYVYRDIDRPIEAIKHFEDAVNITLEMRRGLKREDRKAFLKQEEGTALALIELLIEQNQPEKAFEWANLTTTFDLADYNRLIDAKVANPEIQKEIDDWNQKNEQLNFLEQQLQEEYSTAKTQEVNQLKVELNRQAETITNQYPEVAELFETKPTDIAILRENIAPDTAIIQPVILSDKIAIFIFNSQELKVITKDINTDEFDKLITQYRQQLSDHKDASIFLTSEKMYDVLMRPIASEIKTIAPKHLAIIATGKLRYIPFETLRERETKEFLLEKYPIHYLTRISTRKTPSNSSLPKIENMTALVLANPKPTKRILLGTEAEAQHLMDNFPGSKAYFGSEATLKKFKENASRFPILHLGTHGCFNPKGCEDLGMKPHTILFANNEQYDIARAEKELLFKNTEILVLSACETAKEANADGREFSGLAYVLERAGAKTVIGSLWNADDQPSANIMNEFYTNIKKGMSKSEALRQAKISHLKKGEKRNPHFWSPFILIGNN